MGATVKVENTDIIQGIVKIQHFFVILVTKAVEYFETTFFFLELFPVFKKQTKTTKNTPQTCYARHNNMQNYARKWCYLFFTNKMRGGKYHQWKTSIQMRLWWHRVVSNSCNPSAHRHDRILRTFRSQQQQKTNQKNGCRGRGGGRGRGVSKIQWQERRCCEEGRAVRTYWAWGHRNARCGRHGWSAGWPSSSAVCTWVPSRDLPHPLHPRSQALCSPAWTIAEAYHT